MARGQIRVLEKAQLRVEQGSGMVGLLWVKPADISGPYYYLVLGSTPMIQLI